MLRVIANLNYCLALALVGSATAIGLVTPPLRLLLLPLGEITPINDDIRRAPIALAFGIVSVAIIWWIKKSKSIIPKPVTPRGRTILKIGTIATVIGNGALVLALIVSLVGGVINQQFGLAVGFIFAAAFMLAFPLDIVGTVCVELARVLAILQTPQRQE